MREEIIDMTTEQARIIAAVLAALVTRFDDIVNLLNSSVRRVDDDWEGVSYLHPADTMRSVYAICAVSIFRLMGITNVPFELIKHVDLLKKGVYASMFGMMGSL